jgi:hypothetical protein
MPAAVGSPARLLTLRERPTAILATTRARNRPLEYGPVRAVHCDEVHWLDPELVVRELTAPIANRKEVWMRQ